MKTYETHSVDKMILLDIDASSQGRSIDNFIEKEISQHCFMPLTIGGGITSCLEIENLLSNGADKISLNTAALGNLGFVKEAVEEFGSSCITISIDLKNANQPKIYNKNISSEFGVFEFIKIMEDSGVGEFFICDIDREGTQLGPNYKLAELMRNNINKPLIYAGGIAAPDDCADLISNSDVDAIGCSSIFHFTDATPDDCRLSLLKRGVPARLTLDKINC